MATAALIPAVAGSGAWSGPVVLELFGTHGVHLSDLLALGAWSGVVLFALRLGRRRPALRRSRRGRRSSVPPVAGEG